MGNCVVTSIWRDSNNVNNTHTTRYQLFLNGTNSRSINTTNKTETFSLIPVPCAPHQISISASNVCGQSQQSTPITLDSNRFHNITDLISSYYDRPSNGGSKTNKGK